MMKYASFSEEAVIMASVHGVQVSSKAAFPGAKLDAGPWASPASFYGTSQLHCFCECEKGMFDFVMNEIQFIFFFFLNLN